MGQSAAARPFRLLEFFKLASLVAFALVGGVLFLLEREERVFFEASHREQSAKFAQAQLELVTQQRRLARDSLLMEHEAGHLTLATVLANTLWDSHFGPLLAQAQDVAPAPGAGRRIAALPGFGRVDAAVHAMMKGSTVFKVKVYDLRGLTVYASDPAQVGDDITGNLGWQHAVAGRPFSEFIYRDRFNALDGLAENRDLIQSYLPVRRNGRMAGVFELYSDVTPLLTHLNKAAAQIGGAAERNLVGVEQASAADRERAVANSYLHFAVLAALLALLYAVLYLLVRNGQRILDEQAAAREAAVQREKNWHRDKMAALATMAANASHEIGNPLAIISGLAEDIERAQAAGEPLHRHAEGIAEQTWRIAEMTRRITEFASARSETAEPLDLNDMVQAVRHFLSFDSRYRLTWVEEDLEVALPLCVGVPDHLNEVLMNLLQAYAESSLKSATLVRVGTRGFAREVMIRIDSSGTPSGAPRVLVADGRLELARQRIEGMGGRFVTSGGTCEIWLPRHEPSEPEEDAAAATSS